MSTDKFWVVGQKYRQVNTPGTMTCIGFEDMHVVLLFASGLKYLVGKHKRNIWIYKAV